MRFRLMPGSVCLYAHVFRLLVTSAPLYVPLPAFRRQTDRSASQCTNQSRPQSLVRSRRSWRWPSRQPRRTRTSGQRYTGRSRFDPINESSAVMIASDRVRQRPQTRMAMTISGLMMAHQSLGRRRATRFFFLSSGSRPAGGHAPVIASVARSGRRKPDAVGCGRRGASKPVIEQCADQRE